MWRPASKSYRAGSPQWRAEIYAGRGSGKWPISLRCIFKDLAGVVGLTDGRENGGRFVCGGW